MRTEKFYPGNSHIGSYFRNPPISTLFFLTTCCIPKAQQFGFNYPNHTALLIIKYSSHLQNTVKEKHYAGVD